MKVNCAICNRPRDASACKAFTTTAEDRENLRKLGEKVPKAVYYYCRPCVRLMENPSTAIELMRGVVHGHARALGTVNADEVADRYKNRLLAKTKFKPPS